VTARGSHGCASFAPATAPVEKRSVRSFGAVVSGAYSPPRTNCPATSRIGGESARNPSVVTFGGAVAVRCWVRGTRYGKQTRGSDFDAPSSRPYRSGSCPAPRRVRCASSRTLRCGGDGRQMVGGEWGGKLGGAVGAWVVTQVRAGCASGSPPAAGTGRTTRNVARWPTLR
jgi:hypothetical protein